MNQDFKHTQAFADQASAEQAVRNRQFVVGSIDQHGVLSFSPRPVVHVSEVSAANEAERLSQLHPNKTFIWVRFLGGRKVVTTPQRVAF